MRAAASTRPRTPTACRRSRPATPRPAQEGGRVLHLARGRDPRGARRGRRRLHRAVRRAARRQRAIRSAERVHAQEPALHGATDRGGCRDPPAGRWARSRRRCGGAGKPCASGDSTQTAAAPGRQGPHRLERPDDRRVRARGARARRRGAGSWTMPGGPRTFVRAKLWNPATGRLLRRYRKGEAGVDGYAEDYAYLIFGLLELFQADGDPQWLEWALALQERQNELFWDPVGRRLVQHDRSGCVGAAAAERGLRRRRAGGELDRRAESADARAPRPGAQGPEPRARQTRSS